MDRLISRLILSDISLREDYYDAANVAGLLREANQTNVPPLSSHLERALSAERGSARVFGFDQSTDRLRSVDERKAGKQKRTRGKTFFPVSGNTRYLDQGK